MRLLSILWLLLYLEFKPQHGAKPRIYIYNRQQIMK